MIATKLSIPDGVYFLHPEGSAWTGCYIRNNRCVSLTEECLSETHANARDSWAGITPSDDDAIVLGQIARAVIRLVMPDTNPDMILVTRPE